MVGLYIIEKAELELSLQTYETWEMNTHYHLGIKQCEHIIKYG